VPDAVTYTATLPLSRESVLRVASLLHAHHVQVGTRRGRRALGAFEQAVLFLRWILHATKIAALAADNAVGLSTAYRYIGEALGVLAAEAPDLHQALAAAQDAGYTHLMIDGTLVPTDRCRAIGPTEGVDLWWSGKHHHHGGNIQVITAPDGWPIWTSPVRPGREHDTTCARTHEGLLTELDAWSTDGRVVLGDLGYEGERDRLVLPVKKTSRVRLTDDQATYNALHTATRALAERGNAILKTTFTALRHVTISPGRIGTITAAALVILHTEHHRTV